MDREYVDSTMDRYGEICEAIDELLGKKVLLEELKPSDFLTIKEQILLYKIMSKPHNSINDLSDEEYKMYVDYQTRYYLRHDNLNIAEQNKDLIEKLSEEDKNKFETLETERKELLAEIKEIREKEIEQKKEEPEEPTEEKTESISEIRAEMTSILGRSLFSGIEDEKEFKIEGKFDENLVKRLNTLKKEINELKMFPIGVENLIDEKRCEMFVILGIDPLTYGKNYELINSLDAEQKARFEELYKKHDKYMDTLKGKYKKNKEEEPTETKEDPAEEKNEEKTVKTSKREDEIRSRMAEILSKKNKKIEPYIGIENVNINDIEYELDENEKDEFLELKEELKQKTEKKENRKRRRVKMVESAKKFWQKHNKTILRVAGLIILAIAITQLLPSIMYFNSVFWHELVGAGALPNVGLPKALNDINLFIGSKIGANYAATTGMWTLANGAALNAGAAQASLLGALGKVVLTSGISVVGSSMVIRKACNLIVERIQNRKDKQKDNKENKSTYAELVEKLKNGYEHISELKKNKNKDNDSKKTTVKEMVETLKEKYNQLRDKATDKKENSLHRSNVDEKINEISTYLIKNNYITKEEKEKLSLMDTPEFIEEIKKILKERVINKKETETIKLTRTDLDPDVTDFINYCIAHKVYTKSDLDIINNDPPEQVNAFIKKDERFKKFIEELKKETEEKEKTEGKGK